MTYYAEIQYKDVKSITGLKAVSLVQRRIQDQFKKQTFPSLHYVLLVHLYQQMHKYIYIYNITNAPTCFSTSVPSSGSSDIVFAEDGAETPKHLGVF
jgi:hypothetical protein